MVKRGIKLPDSRILVMGITFKEDCPDVRNTRVIDVIRELQGYGAMVEIYDPWVEPAAVQEEYGVEVMSAAPEQGRYEGIVLAVAHRQFMEMAPEAIRAFGKAGHVLYDIKSVLPADMVDARL
jgi:UDP-N-acetyl-D-galactosamine dehydrogenase